MNNIHQVNSVDTAFTGRKYSVKTLIRQGGFTLVELMVVVAIIGLLSAVAIPNFKKYQAKSKTAEAKLQLAAIYTAEQSFYADYSLYAICLSYMGYDPSVEAPSRYYLTGFPNTSATISTTTLASAQNSGMSSLAYTAGTPLTNNGVTYNTVNTGGCPNGAGLEGSTFFLPAKKIGTAIANLTHIAAGDPALVKGNTGGESGDPAALTSGIGLQEDPDSFTFRASAVGIIDSSKTATTNSSMFLINEDKKMVNPRAGY